MTPPALSICIPTYNFGDFIGATLESIVSQLPENAEIVVLDGGSTDATAQVVVQFQAKYPQILYHRQGARGGIDRDMARSIDLARGLYCWLFSADDAMRPGSIEKIMRAIRTSRDVYLCKHTSCDFDMKAHGETAVLGIEKETTFDLGDAAQRLRYFELAQTTEAFFSFMGGIVVKREKWNSIPLNESFIGSCWAHVARMLELTTTGLSVTYIPEALLDRRGGNDSFADKGMVNRYRIAIDGYHRLAATFFASGSREAFHIRRVIRNEFNFMLFLYAEMQCRREPAKENLVLLNQLLHKAYCDAPFTGLLIRLGCLAFPGRPYRKVRGWYKSAAKAFRRPGRH
jgi:abequosyltransferase